MERDDGGDPVCWLHRLCPECGAVPSEQSAEEPGRCWRCGHDLRGDAGREDAG